MRVGSGFDIHRFECGEYLTLGGVKIPFSKALRAHSDGDVLVHSLIDAILGAINVGDIGAHFPDDDVQYKNANSLDLLQNIYKLMSSEGYFLMDWYPEGNHLLVRSKRDQRGPRVDRFFKISSKVIGREELLFDAHGDEGRVSKNGKISYEIWSGRV